MDSFNWVGHKTPNTSVRLCYSRALPESCAGGSIWVIQGYRQSSGHESRFPTAASSPTSLSPFVSPFKEMSLADDLMAGRYQEPTCNMHCPRKRKSLDCPRRVEESTRLNVLGRSRGFSMFASSASAGSPCEAKLATAERRCR